MNSNGRPASAPTDANYASGAAIRPDKFLRMAAVEEFSGLKKSSIYLGAKAGTFPAPVRLSARAIAWRESDLIRWASQRVTAGGR